MTPRSSEIARASAENGNWCSTALRQLGAVLSRCYDRLQFGGWASFALKDADPDTDVGWIDPLPVPAITPKRATFEPPRLEPLDHV